MDIINRSIFPSDSAAETRRSPCGFIPDRSIVLDLLSSIIDRARAYPRGKTRTSLYIARPAVVRRGFIGYRETGALITFVFQGVQTRGWIRFTVGRVRNERTLS